MRITDIEGIMVRLPEVRVIGDGCQTILIILVHTDAGITGIGEAHTNPLVSKAILEAPLCSVSSTGLKHLLIGQDPRDINRLYDLMIKRTADLRPPRRRDARHQRHRDRAVGHSRQVVRPADLAAARRRAPHLDAGLCQRPVRPIRRWAP